jgi:Mg2+ and Co2+ transporter CorA
MSKKQVGEKANRETPTLEEIERREARANLRLKVDSVFSDGLMVFLALLMIPIILIPFVVQGLPPWISDLLFYGDIVIILFFAIEYFLKFAVAEDRWAHFKNGWHLLDLFIVILPTLELLHLLQMNFVLTSPILRLLRLVRIFAVGGRSLERRTHVKEEAAPHIEVSDSELRILGIDNTIENVLQELQMGDIKRYLENPEPTWIDITGISDNNLEELSNVLDMSSILLAGYLNEESLPRIDYINDKALIFVQIPDLEDCRPEGKGLKITRSGTLIICSDTNIVTLSKRRNDNFEAFLVWANSKNLGRTPLLVALLYSMMDYVMEKYKQILTAVEQELLRLENLPRNATPRNFLEYTFQLKKDVNRLVFNLLHLKEILEAVLAKRVPIKEYDASYNPLFDLVNDSVAYFHESAMTSRENLKDLIELHINTTSYEMNRVMKLLAVMTGVTLVPTLLGGLLGMNTLDSPWNIFNWQMVLVLSLAMMWVGYVFYKLGWLKS